MDANVGGGPIGDQAIPVVASQRGRRVPELDGLRGLAILFVLIWHLFVLVALSFPPGHGYTIAAQLLRWTWSGVDLFFVLSGFLIGGILMDTKESPNYFKTFYLRRAFRILPLYGVVVIAYAVLSALVPGSPYLQSTGLFVEDWSVLPYVLFVQNIWSGVLGQWGPAWLAVTWSLAVEEQFYLFLPFVVRFLRRPALSFLVVLLILAAPLVRIALFEVKNPFWSYMLLPSRLDALGLGVLVAIVSRNERAWAAVSKHWRLVYLTFGVFSLRILWHILRLEASAGTRAMSYSGYTSFAILYVCLLLIVLVRKGSLLAKVARFGPLRYLGGVSYFVYLFHQNVSACLQALLMDETSTPVDHLWLTLLALAIILALAQLSWTWFEKPLIDRGHTYRY